MQTQTDTISNPQYTIKSVSEITGILPVTIRAWERRHEILSPFRSENRYRMYSDQDVAVLHWIKNRVDNGITISNAVSELKILLKSGRVPEITPQFQEKALQQTGIAPEEYSQRLYLALTAQNEKKAFEIYNEVNSAFSLLEIFTLVIIPMLEKVGDAWYRGEIRVATEHFASNFIRGRLLSIYQSLPTKPRGAHILVGCAPDEFHEIGSLMLSILLRKEGYRVEYLGADIPLDDLVEYSESEQPDMIILSATMPDSAAQLQKMGPKLSKLRKAPLFGFGGSAFVRDLNLRNRTRGICIGDTLEQAVHKTEELLKPV